MGLKKKMNALSTVPFGHVTKSSVHNLGRYINPHSILTLRCPSHSINNYFIFNKFCF